MLESAKRNRAEEVLQRLGYEDYRWIEGSSIVVAHWVRFKCTFGCISYGRKATCPPQVPSVEECRAFFREYEGAVILHFAARMARPEDRGPWSGEISKGLVRLEKEIFWAGFFKAFVLFMDECRFCQDCTGRRDSCVHKEQARPGPESLAVDVFSTARSVGYPIETLSNYDETMNRYALLMVE